MCEGHAFDPSELAGYRYRGISLGLPGWVDRLTWKKFVKAFRRDPETGVLCGWNVRIVQSPLDDPAWEPKIARGGPVTFGHFRVTDLAGYRVPAPVRSGVMLDYGLGGNRWFDPVSRLRDPLVAVHPGNSDLLLGWSYVDLGFFRFGTPSYFVLERHAELTSSTNGPGRPA